LKENNRENEDQTLKIERETGEGCLMRKRSKKPGGRGPLRVTFIGEDSKKDKISGLIFLSRRRAVLAKISSAAWKTERIVGLNELRCTCKFRRLFFTGFKLPDFK